MKTEMVLTAKGTNQSAYFVWVFEFEGGMINQRLYCGQSSRLLRYCLDAEPLINHQRFITPTFIKVLQRLFR